MKKKELKKLVRELDLEVEEILAREHQASNKFTNRQIELVDERNAALRRVAVLEQQCAATTPVLHEAAERVKQSDAALAAHWANVGAFVERANRIEAAAEKMRLLLMGGASLENAAAVVLAFDEAKGPGWVVMSPPVAAVCGQKFRPAYATTLRCCDLPSQHAGEHSTALGREPVPSPETAPPEEPHDRDVTGHPAFARGPR